MAHGPREIIAPPANEIIEDDDFGFAFADQNVRNMRTDVTRSSGYQYSIHTQGLSFNHR
jgi:hypothetical protein